MGYDRPLKNDSIIKIPIKLMGRVSETDRAVKVVMIPEESTATEGEDIEILSAYLPANSIFGNVEVRLKRTEAVDNEMLFARIRLASNENFHTDYSTSRYDLRLIPKITTRRVRKRLPNVFRGKFLLE